MQKNMVPSWRPALEGEFYFGGGFGSQSNPGQLLSSESRFFTPQWVWDVELGRDGPLYLRGGREPCNLLVSKLPVRNAVRLGFCAEAVVDEHFNITCSKQRSDEKPGRPPARLRVAIFPQTPSLSTLFAHHLLDAAAMLGLATPLAQAGYSIEYVHTGLLQQAHVRLNPPPWLSLHANKLLRVNEPIRNFALAVAMPASSSDSFVLEGFQAEPGTRQPERQRDWLPSSAYAIPFARGCTACGRHGHAYACERRPYCGKRQGMQHALRRSNTIGLISRTGARRLKNEEALVSALRPSLAARNLSLLMLPEEQHRPEVFRSLLGVIGVHGTAFGNVHACAPGTVVIEITGALMPRTWANFATAIGMEYFAYVAPIFPRSLWTFHSRDHKSDVLVDVKEFVQFVNSAIDTRACAHLNARSTRR
jgi:hypothetical protein